MAQLRDVIAEQSRSQVKKIRFSILHASDASPLAELLELYMFPYGATSFLKCRGPANSRSVWA
jgi:hypothetical protein